MKISRRNILKTLPALCAPTWLTRPSFASAPTQLDRHFVFVYFGGGWDNLISLDPRDPDIFTPDRISETGIELGYDALDTNDPLVQTDIGLFGSFIGRLSQHTDKLAVLRGMTMGSVAHNSARRHALTGFLPAGTSVRRSSLSTVLAAHLGSSNPIPNLSLGVDTFNLDQPMWANAFQAKNIDDLFSGLSKAPEDLREPSRDALETFFHKQQQRATHKREEEIYENRLLSRELLNQDLAQYFNLNSSESQNLLRQEHYGIPDDTYGKSGELAFAAAQALTNGISRCVSIDIAQSLDAHQGDIWENDHGPRIQQGCDAVALLMEDLAATPYDDSSSWLDHTTIWCFSEFGRTALKNNNGGRDHSLINSMMLMGAGIKGGQVIGASSDVGRQAQPVDLATGLVHESGELLTNNHIARSLMHSIGIEEDLGDYRAEPILAMLE